MLFFWFYVGCCCGSFLTVVATRTVQGTSFQTGRSHCQWCQRPLRWWELLPVLSFTCQRGRCRTCHQRLPWSLLIWEVTAGWCFWLSPPVNQASCDWLLFLLSFQLLSTFDSICWGFPTWLLVFPSGLAFVTSQKPLSLIISYTLLYLLLLMINRKGNWIGNGDLDLLWLLLLVFPLTAWCGIILLASLFGLGWLLVMRKRALPFLPLLFDSTLLYLTGLVCFSA
ncbi:prepilin peptidase [Fructilactobacillus cliffordii]|uniref:prepilin peptidase n=1 Tax=Fructilactobacillus cliffordii TaxID=2940299 RepID=UPI003B84948E